MTKISFKTYYHAFLFLTLYVDVIVADSTIAHKLVCKKVSNKCTISAACCRGLVCSLGKCCRKLNDRCEKGTDCCSGKCDKTKKKCVCAKTNANPKLDDTTIKQAVDQYLGSPKKRDAIMKKYGHIETWNVRKVTCMTQLFKEKRSFNNDIGCWDTSRVKCMYEMFLDARKFNKDLNGWKVSEVTDMGGMLYKARKFNGDISKWNVGRVKYMDGMFCDAESFNGDLSDWKVSKVTTMKSMFGSAYKFNRDISKWDVSAVTNMEGMFYNALVFNKNLSGWVVSNLRKMGGMFYEAYKFNSDLSGWNTERVTSMPDTFYKAYAFESDLSSWTVSQVTDMQYTFYKARSFNSDLSDWDVSKVSNMIRTFYQALSFNGDITSWVTTQVTNMHKMFKYAETFNLNISDWDIDNVEDMEEMFYNASSFDRELCWDLSPRSHVSNFGISQAERNPEDIHKDSERYIPPTYSQPDPQAVLPMHTYPPSIWSNGDDAKEKVQEGIWKLMLVDFGFARSLTPEDLLIDSKNCQINQEHTLFSLDKAIDKTTSVITNESLSAKDILDLSAIGSKSFAAPEISRNMKKNTRLFSAKSNEKRSSYSEFVSSYSMASDAFSLGCLLRYTFTGVPPQYSIDDYISQQNSVVCLKLKTLFRCVRKKKERDICYRNNCMVPEEIRSIIGALSSLDKSKRISVRACLRSMLTSEEMEELSFSLDTTTFLKVIEISEIESHTCCSETDASN